MFANPHTIIDSFNLDYGMKVADIGAGSGHYALAISKRLGEAGKIYAIDVQKDLLEKLKKEAEHSHLHNIEVLWGNAEKLEGTHLESAIIDRTILSNVLFQVEDKDTLCEEIKRILRPSGKVFVIDWADASGGIGPHKDDIFTLSKTRDLFTSHGFIEEKEFDTGAHHYGITFKKI